MRSTYEDFVKYNKEFFIINTKGWPEDIKQIVIHELVDKAIKPSMAHNFSLTERDIAMFRAGALFGYIAPRVTK